MLASGLPIVLTMYCEFEGAAMERLFNWPEIEFAPATLARADALCVCPGV